MTTDTDDPRAPFRRAMTLGTVPYYDGTRSTVTVDIQWTGERLSITGNEMHGRACVGGGQNSDTAAQARPRAEDRHTRHDIRRLVAIWDRWHLNDMRAGCEHQRAQGWHLQRIDPRKPSDTYAIHHPGQSRESWNLLQWVYPSEVPGGLMGVACPTCGYRHGTAWQTEEVPTSVLVTLREITKTAHHLTPVDVDGRYATTEESNR